MDIEKILEEINKEKAIITATQERLAALKEKRDILQKNDINNLIVGQMYSINDSEYILVKNKKPFACFMRMYMGQFSPGVQVRSIEHCALHGFKIKQLKSQEHREMAKQVMKFIANCHQPKDINNA